MAILGVLAVVVLIAINPVQQLARTRDTGRKSAVTQVGHALEAYYTGRGGTYLTNSNCAAVTSAGGANGWLNCLVTTGELSTAPSAIAYTVGSAVPCTVASLVGAEGDRQNNLCYKRATTTNFMTVYARMESNVEISKCPAGSTFAWFVWASADGRAGLICTNSASEPGAGSNGTNYID